MASSIRVYLWRPSVDWDKFKEADIFGPSDESLERRLGVEVGHAAVEVVTHDTQRELYISYWGNRTIVDHDHRREQANHFVLSLEEDEERCDRAADKVIAIGGLSARAYDDAYGFVKGVESLPYHWAKHNCCTVAYRALEAAYRGGANLETYRAKSGCSLKEVLRSGLDYVNVSMTNDAATDALRRVMQQTEVDCRSAWWIWAHADVGRLALLLSCINNGAATALDVWLHEHSCFDWEG